MDSDRRQPLHARIAGATSPARARSSHFSRRRRLAAAEPARPAAAPGQPRSGGPGSAGRAAAASPPPSSGGSGCARRGQRAGEREARSASAGAGRGERGARGRRGEQSAARAGGEARRSATAREADARGGAAGAARRARRGGRRRGGRRRGGGRLERERGEPPRWIGAGVRRRSPSGRPAAATASTCATNRGARVRSAGPEPVPGGARRAGVRASLTPRRAGSSSPAGRRTAHPSRGVECSR